MRPSRSLARWLYVAANQCFIATLSPHTCAFGLSLKYVVHGSCFRRFCPRGRALLVKQPRSTLTPASHRAVYIWHAVCTATPTCSTSSMAKARERFCKNLGLTAEMLFPSKLGEVSTRLVRYHLWHQKELGCALNPLRFCLALFSAVCNRVFAFPRAVLIVWPACHSAVFSRAVALPC